jgi:hypothetical protein
MDILNWMFSEIRSISVIPGKEKCLKPNTLLHY